MPFQQDADIFTHGATVGAGLPGQIVVEGFGQVQLDIAVALDAATLSLAKAIELPGTRSNRAGSIR
jgi:hypothetical protein